MIYSKKEKAALEYAAKKHEGQKRFGGEDYITHPQAVAEFLFDNGRRGKYVMAALCHDLLEDTDATKEEITELAGEEVCEAVVLLTKVKPLDMVKYLADIKENKLAYEVKVADRIHNLISALDAPLEFQKKYLKETEEYYLDFAKDSPWRFALEDACRRLKWQVNGYGEEEFED